MYRTTTKTNFVIQIYSWSWVQVLNTRYLVWFCLQPIAASVVRFNVTRDRLTAAAALTYTVCGDVEIGRSAFGRVRSSAS